MAGGNRATKRFLLLPVPRAAAAYTANVYREIQGCYREIWLQGSFFYRDILCLRLAVIVTVGKVVTIIGILFSQLTEDILCNLYRDML